MPAHPDLDPRPRPVIARGKPRPIGVPGSTLCRIDLQASRRSPHNVQPGSLGERDAVSSPGYEAGRRRAIGVVAALSINPRATTPMVRRWTDGTPCVPVVQEAGDEGIQSRRTVSGNAPLTRFSHRAPRECPLKRCLGPKRAAFREGTPSQNRFETARPFEAKTADPQRTRSRALSRHKDEARQEHAENRAPSGCRVRHCAGSASRLRGAPRTMSNRAPTGSAIRSAAPATRQAAGVPSAWSQPSQSTHERPRRWCDAGPLGRHASQRSRRPATRASSGTATGGPQHPKTPHSLGNAQPTSTILTGRLEARPHNARPP